MVIDLVNSITGFNLDMAEFRKLGERIYMMKRMFNLKMGINPKDDRLPQILLKPVKEGGSAGQSPNFQKLKEAYYNYRTFDLHTGYPSQEKLRDLRLNKI